MNEKENVYCIMYKRQFDEEVAILRIKFTYERKSQISSDFLALEIGNDLQQQQNGVLSFHIIIHKLCFDVLF